MTPTRPRFALATVVYSAVIVALVIMSWATESSVGSVFYVAAIYLTLPMGVLIYPALWINVWLTGTLAAAFRLEDRSVELLTFSSIAVIFVLAAVANALIVRAMWRAITDRWQRDRHVLVSLIRSDRWPRQR